MAKKINLFSRNKSSQSHVELILSFVLFAGFVFAIFIFINPLKQPTTSYALFEEVENKIIDRTTINYQYVPVILESALSDEESCFSIDNTLQIPGNLIVKSSDNILNSLEDSDKIYIQNVPEERFYTIYFSEFFNNYSAINPSSCVPLSDDNYSLGVLSYDKMILFEKLLELDADYMANYESLVSDMGLKNNFEFALSDFNGVIISDTLSNNKLKNSNVLARKVLLKTINKNATQVDIFLDLRVW